MLGKTKRLLAVGAAAASLAVAVPAPGNTAPAPCRAAASVVNGNRIEIVLAGHYVGRATDRVTLTCGVIQNGLMVASATSSVSGAAAVVADNVNVEIAPFHVCYTVDIWDITGWGHRYESSCP